jgi:uncharacterized protein YndB with AHSA1/START domain
VIRGSVILQEVAEPVGRDELFAWFTEPDRLSRWMGVDAAVDLRPGGEFSCTLPGDRHWDGLVVEADPPSRLVVTLGWRDTTIGLPPGMSLVTWDFYLDARGSRLRMVHDHVPADLLVLHNDTWGRLFARLRNVLLGRAPGPHPLEDLDRRMRELEAEGGLT